MRLIAIDLGRLTGWAHWDGNHVKSGVKDWGKTGKVPPGQVLNKLRWWMRNSSMFLQPHVIAYEEPFRRGSDLLTKMVGVLEMCAADSSGAELISIRPTSLKKWATGSGKASKLQMLIAAQKKWTDYTTYDLPVLYMVADDNEADALCLLAWAREKFEGKVEQKGVNYETHAPSA